MQPSSSVVCYQQWFHLQGELTSQVEQFGRVSEKLGQLANTQSDFCTTYKAPQKFKCCHMVQHTESGGGEGAGVSRSKFLQRSPPHNTSPSTLSCKLLMVRLNDALKFLGVCVAFYALYNHSFMAVRALSVSACRPCTVIVLHIHSQRWSFGICVSKWCKFLKENSTAVRLLRNMASIVTTTANRAKEKIPRAN